MPKSKAERLYDAHHEAFEAWFTQIHPNHDLTFAWEFVHDSGWYQEPTANGAWITWLSLTGKHDTVASLSEEITTLNSAQEALSARTRAVLLPLADQWIANNELDKLRELLSTFPSCATRMTLAGKLAQALHDQQTTNN